MTFKELVKSKRFTNESLGKHIGKSHTTIYNWCNHKTEPSCKDIVKLSKVLNLSIEFLVMMFANEGR